MSARVQFGAAVVPTAATTPAGADTQVQFNDAGSFGASSGLTFDKTNGELVVNQLADGKGLSIYGNGANAGSYFKASVDNFGQPIISTNGTARFANTGSFLLTAGGYARFTSSGFQVVSSYSSFGTTANLGARVNIKGTGATAATTSLLVQNSSGTDLWKFRDDGKAIINGLGEISENGATLNIGRGGVDIIQMSQSSGQYMRLYASLIMGTGYTYGSFGDVLIQQRTASDEIHLRNYLGANLFSVLSNGNVGIGTSANDASAKLQIDSTTQGLLPPRMTSVQLAAIAAPAAGLQVYDTTTNNLNYFNGTVWVAL